MTNIVPGGQASAPLSRPFGSDYSVEPDEVLASESESPSAWFHPLVPAIGFVLLAAMTCLYATGSELYYRILSAWMFGAGLHPFSDLAAIPAWQRCWQLHGFDVYSSASMVSCGTLPIIYSPLWLRLTFLPTDPAWTNWLGLPVVSAFLLSLGLLPLPRLRSDRALVILATFSAPPVFAMERANVDLIMFLLAVGAAFCLEGKLACRILGYGLMLIAGLLKFYPLVLLALMLRERLKVLAAVGLAATAIVAGTAFVFLDELRRLTPAPSGAPFHFMWGARNIPTGFPTVMRAFLHAAGVPARMTEVLAGSPRLPALLTALLLTGTLVMAVRLARRADLRAGLAAISDRTHRFLLIGGILVVGCFFAGQNINYRSIFLLLLLPGTLALTGITPSRSLRGILTLTTASILCVLWELSIRLAVADIFGGSYLLLTDSLPVYTVWVVKELAWWWLVTVLIAILIRFAADSRAWREIRLMFRPVRAGRAD
jgi:hypothetical protein